MIVIGITDRQTQTQQHIIVKEINKMKQFKIIEAYKTTEAMANIDDIPASSQWKIYKLRKMLRPHVEFQDERMNAINQKYLRFADENNEIKGEPFLNYKKEIEELGNLEIELEDLPISMPLAKGINFKQIEALEGFIDFQADD